MNLAAKDLNVVIAGLDDGLEGFKGFAFSELGRDSDMYRWLEQRTAKTVAGGENFYYAALLMAMRGDNFKAMEYLQKALDNGYGSLLNLQYDTLSPLSLKSLREDSGFPLLIEKAQRNFVEHY